MTIPSSLKMWRTDQLVIFQPVGRATMQQGIVLRRVAEQALVEKINDLRVDLQHCTYMDSTFLGTLLFFLRTMTKRRDHFSLLSPSPECRELIEQMGLTDVYPVVEATPLPTTEWIELCSEREDAGHRGLDVLQAHQELAKLPGKVGETFQQVASCLARDDIKQHNEPKQP